MYAHDAKALFTGPQSCAKEGTRKRNMSVFRLTGLCPKWTLKKVYLKGSPLVLSTWERVFSFVRFVYFLWFSEKCANWRSFCMYRLWRTRMFLRASCYYTSKSKYRMNILACVAGAKRERDGELGRARRTGDTRKEKRQRRPSFLSRSALSIPVSLSFWCVPHRLLTATKSRKNTSLWLGTAEMRFFYGGWVYFRKPRLTIVFKWEWKYEIFIYIWTAAK